MELKSPWKNAKVIGANIASADYLRQEPGVGRGHKDFVMSRSELMMFASCPARWINGYEPKDTEATYFGSLLDCLLTDTARFSSRYVVRPKTVTATKTMACVKDGEAEEGDDVPWRECKEAKDWKAANKGREAVSAEDYAEVLEARERLVKDPRIKALFDCSTFQVMCVAEYHDKDTKLVVPVKTLIDLLPAKGSDFQNSIADFKTCRTAAPGKWASVVEDRNYDCQAALITDIFVAATGEDRNTFLHVLQENVFPFQPARRIVGLKFIDHGRDKYLTALRLYCQCLQANRWPDWDDSSAMGGWGMCEPTEFMQNRWIHTPPIFA